MKRLRNLAKALLRPPVVGQTPADVVFTENKWRLLRYRSGAGPRLHKTPVLLVPSLINRHYVLDLTPGRSFVEYLRDQGHDVFMIDWGTPGPEDRYLEFDTICDRYIGRALRVCTEMAGSPKAHLLGYCLGGTLAAIHVAARPERVQSFVALAAPIDFHDEGLLSLWMQPRFFDVKAMVDAFGNVPWPLLQASFHMLKPTMNLVKGVNLVDRAWDDEFLDGFLAVEKWGNDNVSFPGAAYQRYVEALYQRNELLRGEFRLNGRPARLDAIELPTLAVTFKDDHIVPFKSAQVLLERIRSRDKKHLDLRGGHVGAVVSRKAAGSLWPELSNWWAERQSPPQTERVDEKSKDDRSTRAARSGERNRGVGRNLGDAEPRRHHRPALRADQLERPR